jgi:Domain of unknown function (DUF4136)
LRVALRQAMTLLMTLLLLAGPVTTSAEYDHQVDFSRYKTWSWHAGGTAAMNPVTDKAIRDAIAKGLAARGLSRVEASAALFVVYDASRTTQIDIVLLNSASPAPPSGIRYAQKGSLLVHLVDATSGKVVWRGQAAGVLRYGPKEIAAQVDAAVEEMLARFPPSAP